MHKTNLDIAHSALDLDELTRKRDAFEHAHFLLALDLVNFELGQAVSLSYEHNFI